MTVSSAVHPYFLPMASISGMKLSVISRSVMPHRAAYWGRKLMLTRLLSTEKREICVNLVMPVMKTNFS